MHGQGKSAHTENAPSGGATRPEKSTPQREEHPSKGHPGQSGRRGPKDKLEVAKGRGFGAKLTVPLFIGTSFNPINTTMISVALLPIAQDLHVSAATCIWLVAILYLVSAVFQPTMGKFADQFGPKKIFVLGCILVMAAGAIPSILHTFGGALLARFLIGIGTSCAYPAAMAFLADQSVRVGKPTPPGVLAGISISALVTTAIGPVLGGVLIALFGWTSIFLVNIPLALFDLILALIWLPSDSTRPDRTGNLPLTKAVDFWGIGLFSIMLTSLLLFLLDLEAGMYWLVAVAVVAAIVLYRWERRRKLPFIDINMLESHAPLRRTYLRFFLYFLCNYLVVYGMAQWAQASMGLGSDVAGLAQLPMAIVAAVTSLLIRNNTKIYLPLIFTALLPLAAGLLMQTLSGQSSLVWLMVIFMIFGIPHGLSTVSNQAAVYRQAPLEQMGNASGLSRTFVHIAAVISSCIIAWVFGEVATDAGIHTIGIVIAAASLVCLLLTAFDKELRIPMRDVEPPER